MKKPIIQVGIQELFMAKAGKNGWDRCFHGTIDKRIDADGNPILCGKVKVNDTIIQATASNRDELGEKLDELVLYALNSSEIYHIIAE